MFMAVHSPEVGLGQGLREPCHISGVYNRVPYHIRGRTSRVLVGG